MGSDLLTTWQDSFLEVVQESATAALLKNASLERNLSDWTTHSTTAVVESCRAIGWQAAGRGHRLDVLPQAGQEYLAIDVMAFANGDEATSNPARWPLPVAVFELENSPKDERVAYSLWKVLCVQADLRLVLAYRDDWDQARELIGALSTDVVGGFTPHQRAELRGQTAVVTGSRGQGETFPYGYFKFWRLDANLGRFERL